eukprot:4892661-Prymnesium_polylepis.1
MSPATQSVPIVAPIATNVSSSPCVGYVRLSSWDMRSRMSGRLLSAANLKATEHTKRMARQNEAADARKLLAVCLYGSTIAWRSMNATESSAATSSCLPPEEVRLVGVVQEVDRAAQHGGPVVDDRAAASEEQGAVDEQLADRVEADRNRSERLRRAVVVAVALDGYVRLQPAAVVEVVALKRLERHLGNERVGEEEEAQHVGRRLLEQRRR